MTRITGANGKLCGCRICREPDTMNKEWLPPKKHRRVFDWQGTYLSTRYANARQNAIKRGLAWNMARSEFLMFALGDCYYCGAEPKPVIETHPAKNKKSKNGITMVKHTTGYSSLDRADNAKGYSVDNVVSCCMACNISKGTYTHDEYIERCIRVATIHDSNEQFLINAREG